MNQVSAATIFFYLCPYCIFILPIDVITLGWRATIVIHVVILVFVFGGAVLADKTDFHRIVEWWVDLFE
jgi:hypothetical protein